MDGFDYVYVLMMSEIGVVFECVVFLGFGVMCFVVCEVFLKVMEFLVGCIFCLWDSLFGFCYGLKLFVIDKIEIVVFMFFDYLLYFYEVDLIDELI